MKPDQVRNSYHACRIGYQVAMFRLMIGCKMSADCADRYLRCMGKIA